MRAYYENHDSNKDVVIFKSMTEKFDMSERSLKRLKKKYGWSNRQKTGVKSKVTYPEVKPKVELKEKTNEVKQEKKPKEKKNIIPDPQRLTLLQNLGRKSKTGDREMQIDLLSEMLLQGARPIDIKHFIKQQKQSLKENNIWSEYDFEKQFSSDLKHIRDHMINSYRLDIELEESLYMHRNHFLFSKAVKEGAYLAAQKIENDRIAHIEKFRGTTLVDKLRRLQKEHSLTESQIIKLIDDVRRNSTESIPE